jgi:hypothetical protein
MKSLQQAFNSFLQSDEISGVSNYRQFDAKTTLFSYEGINFLYVYESDDPSFFHLIVPRIEVFSDGLYSRMLDFSQRYKIAKVLLIDNHVWFSFEQIVLNIIEGDYRLFKLSLKILVTMFNEWRSSESTGEIMASAT